MRSELEERAELDRLRRAGARIPEARQAERRTRALVDTIAVQRALSAAASQDRRSVLQLVVDRAVGAFPAADGAVVELVRNDRLGYAAGAGTMSADGGGPGPRSTCSASLYSGTTRIGVLTIGSSLPDAFDEDDAAELDLLAGALSAALRHADDFARTQRLLTERTEALEALADSEERFRLAFENSPLGVLLTSLDTADRGAFLWANPAICAMTGYTARELTGGMTYRQLHHPDDLASSQELLARLVSEELDAFRVDRRYRHKDGRVLDVTLHISVVRDEETGRPRYLVTQVEDVTARRRESRQLEQQATLLEERNRELEAANRLKLDLIGMLGHEIGNPLAVILGYTELASDSWAGFDDEDKRHTVTVIDRNARALSRILREVLALVSLDAGRLTASPEPVDLAAALPSLVAAAPRTGRCRLDVPAGVVALVQPGHLDQIVTNLLSNAAKYAGGATGVTVTSDRAGSVRLRIRDGGRGIPPEFRSRLFERFARADGTAGVKGTGLGLYITRELARANGGDLHHEPGPDGCGAVFVVTLPAPAPEAGPGAASGPAASR